MRRKLPLIAVTIMLLAAMLSGCGVKKDSASVVKDLSKLSDKMDSYQGSGTMTLHTGQQPQTYKVEVWYQQPKFYRIALTSESRDITQIVLRNDDGVFVLTPSLNKSYRFQSDWPENQGQVYLYQTLLQSIVVDNSRQFTADKDSYVFNVMAANYNNGSFARQKIWLNKNDYSPQKVEVTDTNSNILVDVSFDSFQFGKKFDKSAFDMQQNMNSTKNQASNGTSQTGAAGGTDLPNTGAADPTIAVPDGKDAGTDGSAPTQAVDQELAAIEPTQEALPEGVKLLDSNDVQMEQDGQGVMLRYTGTYDFTIVETKSKDRAVSTKQGIALDLGFTIGQLSADDTQSLTWTYDGVDYRLVTANLPQEDMVKVAQSMVDQSGK